MSYVRETAILGISAILLGGAACSDTTVGTADSGVSAIDASSMDVGVDIGDGGDNEMDAAVTLDGAAPQSLPVTLPPSSEHWTFYATQIGGPNRVAGASLDDGGNLWVAGGEEGLFLLRTGAASFARYTMADGLRPYGYMEDGSDPPGKKYLNVISVSGGKAGTVFVGYQGKAPAAGALDCENNWDGPDPDPSIYKSGDADKVTLGAQGISVVHYDISSGPGLVGVEPRGREKLCHVLRIRYDPANQKVWFGGNHGFAMGDANYQGTGNCQWAVGADMSVPPPIGDPLSNAPGHAGCSGVLEHVHPAINGSSSDGSCCVYLTGGYYGVSVDPLSHDPWFGGQMRTTRFHFASSGGDYYQAEAETEDPTAIANRIDVWPDRVEEPAIPSPEDRVDDSVSGAAAMNDGSVWVSSFYYGLAHIDAGGRVVARVGSAEGLAADTISALAADPGDQSLWAGTNYGPGISRLSNGHFTQYGIATLGPDLANEGVSDLQSSGGGAGRKIVVSFAGDATHAGAVAIYDGP